MAIFGPKPWVNPCKNMSIFWLFQLVVFIACKYGFSFYNIVNDIFLAYNASKEKLENWPFLDQNPGFGKMSIFSTFETCCFYTLERRFFVLECRKRHFRGLYCLKRKCWKNGYFSTKTTGKPLWKNVNISAFWTSCF